MKSKIKRYIAFLVLQLVCIFAFAGCGQSHVLDSLKSHNIDTKLLKDYEIVCDIKGETFTGRAQCYGVLVFKNEPAEFLQSFSTEKSDGFSSEKREELENRVDNYSSSLKIPDEYKPNWDDRYIWCIGGGFDKYDSSDPLDHFYSDSLVMIYFPNYLKLVVFETGH